MESDGDQPHVASAAPIRDVHGEDRVPPGVAAVPGSATASSAFLQGRGLRIICFVVLVTLLSVLYDRGSAPAPDDSYDSDSVEPMDGSEDLERALQQAASLYASYNYPQSVSEVFHGTWNKTDHAWELPQQSNVTLRFLTLRSSKRITIYSGLYFGDAAGRMELQLSTVSSPVAGLEVVRGRLHIADGHERTNHDLVVQVDGVYIPAIGRLSITSSESDSVVGVAVAGAAPPNGLQAKPSLTDVAGAGTAGGNTKPPAQDRTRKPGMRGYRGLSESHVFVAKDLLRRAGVFAARRPPAGDSVSSDRALARTPAQARAATRTSVTRKPKDTFLRKSNGHPWEHTQPVGPGSASPDPFSPAAVIDAGDGVVPADLPLDRCEVRATLAFAPVSALVPGVSPFAILQAPTLLSPSGDGVPLMVHGRRMLQKLHDERMGRHLGSSRYVAHVMHARGLVFSDKCGFAFNTTFQALSYDNRQLETQTVHLAAVSTLVTVLQLGAVMYEILRMSNANVAVRTSLVCVSMHALLDAYAGLLFLFAGLLWEPWFASFAVVAFAKLLLVFVLELRLAYVLMRAHSVDAAQPSWLAGWVAHARQFTALFVKFMFSVALGFVASYVFWESLTVLVFLAYSFWLPQIAYAAQHRCETGLSSAYIAMISGTLLFFPLYLWACPFNFMQSLMPYPPSYGTAIALVLWVGAQVGVLAGQARYGPQFFIPQCLKPPKYNYHRMLPRIAPLTEPAALPNPNLARTRAAEWRRASNVLATTSSAEDASPSDDDADTGSGYRCVICTSSVDVVGLQYMVTPCNHIFHSECLLRWMDVKMECPMCRSQLPAP